jgi:hypothetical protein
MLIREQLERLLESHLFRNSKRYPNMLRYVVEHTLAGRLEEMKERSLGVDVFGRPPDYDSNADPVVRMSAAEIRKRIAQYYHEPKHRDQLRIELPVGSYVPEFHWPEGSLPSALVLDPPMPEVVPLRLVTEGLPDVRPKKRRLPFLFAGAMALAAAIAVVAFLQWPASALDAFWRPVLDEPAPILLCAAKTPGDPAQSQVARQQDSTRSGIAWADVVTLTRLTLLVQSKKHPFQLRREDMATFAELQQSSTILIGAFNDAWTMRLTDTGRYGFVQDGTKYSIADRQNNQALRWGIALEKRNSKGKFDLHEDFAIISRVLNHTTGKMLVTVGGLYGYGTEAAGQFLTDPKYLKKFSANLPRGWQSKNLQLVVRTEVIDGIPGPPDLIASSIW